MRKPLLLVCSVLLLSPAILAQSARAPADAAKSIQPSQSIAEGAESLPAQNHELTIPAGTPIDIESAYTVSSVDLRPGDYLTFHVLVPVKLGDATVIDKNALVTARVVEAKRGRHWGKAGKLSWTIEDVVAVDLTRVPLQAQKNLPAGQTGIKGTSHGAEVATKTIVLGALMAPLFPIAPLALMSGFRRGEDAILPQGKRFVVFVQRDTKINVRLNETLPKGP